MTHLDKVNEIIVKRMDSLVKCLNDAKPFSSDWREYMAVLDELVQIQQEISNSLPAQTQKIDSH